MAATFGEDWKARAARDGRAVLRGGRDCPQVIGWVEHEYTTERDGPNRWTWFIGETPGKADRSRALWFDHHWRRDEDDLYVWRALHEHEKPSQMRRPDPKDWYGEAAQERYAPSPPGEGEMPSVHARFGNR